MKLKIEQNHHVYIAHINPGKYLLARFDKILEKLAHFKIRQINTRPDGKKSTFVSENGIIAEIESTIRRKSDIDFPHWTLIRLLCLHLWNYVKNWFGNRHWRRNEENTNRIDANQSFANGVYTFNDEASSI